MSLMDLKASSISPMARKKLKLSMASRVGLSQSSSPTKSRRGLLPTAWGMHWDLESSWSSRLASPGWMTNSAVYLWVPMKPVRALGLSLGDPLHRPHIHQRSWQKHHTSAGPRRDQSTGLQLQTAGDAGIGTACG